MLFVLLIVVVGATRMGKTFGVVQWLATQRRKTVVADPQDSLSREVAKYHVCHGTNKQILYDQVHQTKRAPGILALWESESRDPLQRMRENDLERSLFAEPLYGRRSIDGTTRPRIVEQTEDALKLIQFQRTYAPAYWLPFCFQPLLPDFQFLLNGCTAREVVAKFKPLLKYSPTALRNELAATLRLIEPVCCDPSFIARCGTTDCDDLIQRYDLIIVEGGGATDRTIEIILQWWIYKSIQWVERHKKPLVLVIDEAANWQLVTNDVLRAVATLEKYGLELVVITQSLSIVPTDVRVSLLQNARRVECYRVGSMEDARLMSGVMGVPQFDASSEGSFTGQTRQLMQELMTQPVGVRYVRERGNVFRESSPRLKDCYAWPGISNRMTREAIARIQQGPDFQTPEYFTPADVRGRRGGSSGEANSSNA